MINEEQELISGKVTDGRFAYLVIKSKYYERLNKVFENLNSNVMA